MIDTLLRDADPARGLVPDPSSAEARAMLAGIVAEPRGQASRRAQRGPARRVLIGGVLAGAAVTVALAAPMPWDGGGSRLGSAAYAVTVDRDGSVRVDIRWSEVSDPAKLQADLDRAGARTKIYIEHEGDQCTAEQGTSVGYSDKAVQWHIPTDAAAEDGIVVRPREFPNGGTFVIGIQLVPASEHAVSTYGPSVPAIQGTASYMTLGRPWDPFCLPAH